MRKEWTKEEDDKLIALVKEEKSTRSIIELAKLMNRSKASVTHRAIRLGCGVIGKARVKKHPKEKMEEMVEMSKNGFTDEQISEQLDLKYSFVRSRLGKIRGVKGAEEWTEEEIQWVKENCPKIGVKAVAKHLKVSPKQVYKLKKDIGFKARKKPIPRKIYDEAAICEYYREVRKLRLVSEKFQSCDTKISNILKKNEIEVKPLLEIDQIEKDMAADYLAGVMSAQEIGEKYNRSGDSVRERMKKLGIYDESRKIKFAQRRPLYDIWKEKHGEELALSMIEENKAKHRAHSSGENNPMYGKPTPQGAGNGWKGWFDGFYFRSLRELCFMAEMKNKDLSYKTAETKRLIIPYEFMGVKRTYRPDFIVEDTVYEIKPLKMINTPNILAKTKAAIPYLEKLGLKFVIMDFKVDSDNIKKYYDLGMIKFDRDYEQKFLDFIKNQKAG